MNRYHLTTVLLATLASSQSLADVRISKIFRSGMVLQREQPVRIWGTADASEKVEVRFAGQQKETMANARGEWALQLDPLKDSSKGARLEVRANNTVAVDDVVVGEVWLASGQSNMAMSVASMASGLGKDGERFVAAADLPGIRFAKIGEHHSAVVKAELSKAPTWRKATPETVRGFSAVAYVFARELHRELGVPIGVVDSSWGGKPIESFIPRGHFRGHPTLEKERALGDKADVAGLKALEGGVWARDASWLPGAIYNSRVAPVIGMTARGVIWYQGESNCGTGEDPRHYRHKMRALVEGWRQSCGRDDLPFYYVQLPGFRKPWTGWPFLREEQRLSLEIPRTGMAVTIDIDSKNDIHPANKVDVGRRLALWALAKDYGKDVPCSGPLYRQHRIDGNRIVLQFAHLEKGLMTGVKEGLAPVKETPGVAPGSFEIADSKGRWFTATARIDGSTVIVTTDKVARPTAARYAYDPVPENCNLYNRSGLPASPFCTHPEMLGWER